MYVMNNRKQFNSSVVCDHLFGGKC